MLLSNTKLKVQLRNQTLGACGNKTRLALSFEEEKMHHNTRTMEMIDPAASEVIIVFMTFHHGGDEISEN